MTMQGIRFDIPIPERVRGKNRAPRHHMALARLKRQWGDAAVWGWRVAGRPRLATDPPYTVRVGLPLSRPTLADPHNYTSYEVAWIIDGLVTCGLLPGDTGQDITVLDPDLHKGVQAWVEVT